MSLPPPIFNDFFRNPFGGERNPIGGMGGEGGVLENIQQQVSENGQALQALQGGIGGLPNTPFRNPGDLLDLSTFKPPIAPVQDELRLPTGFEPLPTPSIVDAATDSQAQLRAEYEKAVADAKRQRAEGMLGRVVLPGEMSFEEFARMQLKPGPEKADLFNIAQVEQNPGMDYSQFTPTIGNLYDDTSTGSPQLLNSTLIPTGVINQDRLPSGSLRGNNPIPQPIYERPEPNISMDQLFGRAFAGKPI